MLVWAAGDMVLYSVALLLAKFTNAREYSVIIVLVTSPLKEFRHRISRTMHERGERSRGRRQRGRRPGAGGGRPGDRHGRRGARLLHALDLGSFVADRVVRGDTPKKL